MQQVLSQHELNLERWEVETQGAETVDRFYVTGPGSMVPPSAWLGLQVALLEAVDPALRWVSAELADAE